jgi:hypothetical protein
VGSIPTPGTKIIFFKIDKLQDTHVSLVSLYLFCTEVRAYTQLLLTIYRRHALPKSDGTGGCPHAADPCWKRYKCKIWVRGENDGQH